MSSIIHIDGSVLIAELNKHGWTQGKWIDDETGAICAHQAIRRCSPVPGDAMLVEQVASRQGWGTDWNDAHGRTEAEVRERLAAGVDVTDADLAETFGPQWRAVVSLVRRAAVLTEDEAQWLDAALTAARAATLTAAWDAAWAAVRDAALTSARAAAWDAALTARAAALNAARAAARDAVRDAARDAALTTVRAAWDAAWDAARDAARAIATWDLATSDGPYTVAHRDLLISPWAEVCGLPEGLKQGLEDGLGGK